MTKQQENRAFTKMLKEFPKAFGRISFRERLMLRTAFTYVVEEVIADLKANFDYVLEGKDLEIKELKISDEYIIKTLESKVEKLQEDLRNKRISIKNKKAEIQELIKENEKMKKGLGCETCQIHLEYMRLNDKIRELEQGNKTLEGCLLAEQEHTQMLEQQIEKMKNCNNCKYGYCGWSSQSIDKDGRRTCHAWNKEKQAYCDIGNGSGAKYQLWEIKE